MWTSSDNGGTDVKSIQRLLKLPSPVSPRSAVAGLTEPLQPLTVLIAVASALIHGIWVLKFADGNANFSVGDLATSFALIVLFSYAFGIWLGTLVAVRLSELAFRFNNDLRRRIDSLESKMQGQSCKSEETSQVRTSNFVGWAVRSATLSYAISFAIIWTCIVILGLHEYTYASSPVALYYLERIIRTYLLISDVAILIWTVSVYAIGLAIVFQWSEINRLERKSEVGVGEDESRLSRLTPNNDAIGDALIAALVRVSKVGTGRVKLPLHSPA